MANLSVSWSTTPTTASMTARLTNGDASFIGTRYVDVTVDGVTRRVSNTSGGASNTFSCIFSGLIPGMSYYWTVDLGYQSSAETSITWLPDLSKDGDFITEDSSPDIEPWSWTSSNGSATASQTRTAYSAVSGEGRISDFSYLVWNDMVDKVYDILQFYGYDWDSTYDTYARTRMSSGDRTLTAIRFNSLCHNIGEHYETGISRVSKGGLVYGSYFIDLTDCMNQMDSWT